ncbi:TPA: prepilin-type cleavage/methylation domain-containing protein [Candidatus Sumerlaeota bacterium]|jgi:prepilin-type N-terminal cleavage/methylation domain-containing protein|nr:prepilin-type cleavage/methylation domain-containing protein [Candidatus Sumerlaeota bacterium]
MLKNAKKGFTLVEIMIVVAIIGILVGIAVPGFIKARLQAQGKSCAENLQKIDGAKEQWALENNKTSTDTPAMSDLVSATAANSYLKRTPVCPANQAYTVNNIGADPTCAWSGTPAKSAAFHQLP